MRALLALLWLVSACPSKRADPPAPVANRGGTAAPASRAVATADQAIDAFIAGWARDVRPTMPGHRDPMIGNIDSSMREPAARARYSAERAPCTKASQWMVDLMAQSHYDFVLYGSMDAARQRPDCWSVTYSCCMKGDAGGLVAPDDGALLVVWRIPEG